jgi:hypothetical protein
MVPKKNSDRLLKLHPPTCGVQIGANVLAACFIIDLPDLGGAKKIRKLGVPVRTLVSFEGH